jgi:hypothetical protein
MLFNIKEMQWLKPGLKLKLLKSMEKVDSRLLI